MPVFRQFVQRIFQPFPAITLIFGLVLGLAFSSTVSAHSGAQGVVKERMDRMQTMRKSMKTLGDMVKGNAPLEPSLIVHHARSIGVATDGLATAFPDGSIKGPSEALPAIWEEWEHFVLLSSDLADQARQLEAVAASDSAPAIKQHYLQLAETCRNCHADYRKKKSRKKGTPIVMTDINMAKHAVMKPSPPVTETSPPVRVTQAQDAPSPAKSKPLLEEASLPDPVSQGEYLFRLGGCASCHTADPEAPLAGGLEMETPFGIFYTPNISPDRETGIGGWSEQQFIQAFKAGVSPSGEHYYPAFPYTSYAKMSDQELKALKEYLDSQPAIRRPNQQHQLGFPFDQRWLLSVWKTVFFEAEEFQPVATRSAAWNRGAYIVSGPGHCVECHSPRNLLGALDRDALLTGNLKGPEDEEIPAIHGQKSPRFSTWSPEDIQFALETGVTPEGDALGGSMAHVIENTLSHLSTEDRKAIAEYLAQPR